MENLMIESALLLETPYSEFQSALGLNRFLLPLSSCPLDFVRCFFFLHHESAPVHTLLKINGERAKKENLSCTFKENGRVFFFFVLGILWTPFFLLWWGEGGAGQSQRYFCSCFYFILVFEIPFFAALAPVTSPVPYPIIILWSLTRCSSFSASSRRSCFSSLISAFRRISLHETIKWRSLVLPDGAPVVSRTWQHIYYPCSICK